MGSNDYNNLFLDDDGTSGFNALGMAGVTETPGTTEVDVLARDSNEDVLMARGSTVPSNNDAGFADGALFFYTGANDGELALYINHGTNSNAEFVSKTLDPQEVTMQGGAELDLTSTSSTTTLISQNELHKGKGGDVVVPYKAVSLITTAIAADSTTPVVTIQDSNGNSTGFTLNTYANNDSVDAVRVNEITDGTDTTPVDLSSEDMEATVSTAAADTGTAAGKCKVVVKGMLFK